MTGLRAFLFGSRWQTPRRITSTTGLSRRRAETFARRGNQKVVFNFAGQTMLKVKSRAISNGASSPRSTKTPGRWELWKSGERNSECGAEEEKEEWNTDLRSSTLIKRSRTWESLIAQWQNIPLLDIDEALVSRPQLPTYRRRGATETDD